MCKEFTIMADITNISGGQGRKGSLEEWLGETRRKRGITQHRAGFEHTCKGPSSPALTDSLGELWLTDEEQNSIAVGAKTSWA